MGNKLLFHKLHGEVTADVIKDGRTISKTMRHRTLSFEALQNCNLKKPELSLINVSGLLPQCFFLNLFSTFANVT